MSATLAVDYSGAVTDGFRSFATFLPKLLGFLIIIIVGYFLAKIIATVVDKLLERVGFDGAVERGGIKTALSKSQYDASDIVAKVVFFAIFIPVLSAAVGTLGIAALQQPLAAFITLLPKILVALILVVVGAAIAAAAKKFIEGTLGGLSYGSIVANAASALILLVFLKAALDQVGIATQVTNPILYAVLFAVVGVIVVGVGGGLVKPMQGRWETMLNNASSETDKIRSEARSSSGSQSSSSSAGASSRDDEVYPSDQTTRLSDAESTMSMQR